MLGVALRIVRDRALAEDVIQDAFVQVWEKAASFSPARGEGRGWLFTIVRNRALNVVRQRAVEAPLDDDLMSSLESTLMTPARDASGELPAAGELGALRDCLSQLESDRRQCILLAYVDGCSHAEIADRLATPLGTIKAWIRRSLLALRACLG